MGEFNSDDHYIFYCGQESHRRNRVALIVKKWVQNAVLGCNLKNDRVISVLFQGKPFNITVIQVYTLTHWCWRSWSWSDLWRPRRPPQNNAKKDVIFIIRDWNAKVGSQEIPRVTNKFGLRVQNEAGGRLTKFCKENALVIANILFHQHKRQLYTRTSANGQYWNQIHYILCSRGWRSCLQSAKARPETDCGSDHQLLIVKFRLKLKRAGKITRPVRYELNQIPYEDTVDMTNIFMGLDLVNRVPENYGQRFMIFYRRQWIKSSKRKRNARRQSGSLRKLYK